MVVLLFRLLFQKGDLLGISSFNVQFRMTNFNVSAKAYNLELKHPFSIAVETRTHQPTLIVELSAHGFTGRGEATATKHYGLDIATMMRQLQEWQSLIQSTPFSDPFSFWEMLNPTLNRHPFIQCAVDVAVHDWYGQFRDQPLWKLWETPLVNVPKSTFTIGMDSVEAMILKIKEQPWSIYKVKVNSAPDFLSRMQALRSVTDAPFLIDANASWSPDQLTTWLPYLPELGVVALEQPLAPSADAQLARFRNDSPVPIIADESCQTEQDVQRCAPYFHGVNIKVMKAGGLTPARRMIGAAKRMNLRTMVGCMTESSIGISAIAHLLPIIDFADMDGATLLKTDLADGVRFDEGTAHFPERNGSGALWKPHSQVEMLHDGLRLK